MTNVETLKRLSDIGSRLDIIEGKLDELLRRTPPNETKPIPSQIVAEHQRQTQYRPSSHGASIEARASDLEALAFGPRCVEESAQPNIAPVKHPTLGSL